MIGYLKSSQHFMDNCLVPIDLLYLTIKAGMRFLRMVPPFVTVHMFCASRVWSEIFKFLREFAY